MAFSGELLIEHPCQSKSILQSTFTSMASDESVFSLTKSELSKNKIDSVLASNGVISILGYIPPEKSVEVIGPTKMRAYGWCYSINGLIPDEMPDQILLSSNDSIKWFLSFSTFENNQWIDYCVPVTSSLEASDFICK